MEISFEKIDLKIPLDTTRKVRTKNEVKEKTKGRKKMQKNTHMILVLNQNKCFYFK